MFQKTLTFDDMLLVPQLSDINSRTEIDISSYLDSQIKLNIPIISSPMDTVTEVDMAVAISQAGGLGIVHRYNTIEQQVEIVEDAKCGGAVSYIGAAIGVSGDWFLRSQELIEAGVDVICVDVAHGHHENVKTVLGNLKSLFPKLHIMAGNVATGAGYEYLADAGADSVRVGVGGGCFVPGTLIDTENGLKKIEDIKVGDRVFSHTGKLQPVIDTLTFNRDEEIISINGIECTKNHEFYIVDKENSNRVNENNIHLFARWIHAEELDIDKHLLIELE